MKKIHYFTRHKPDPDGGGGFHRTYQIYYELISAFGEDSVKLPILQPEISKNHKLKSYYNAVLNRYNTLKPILQRGFSQKILFNNIIENNQSGYNLFTQIPLDLYKDYLVTHGVPSLCIMDNPRFLPIIKFNKKNGIPTFYCPQNFDSFDMFAHHLDQPTYCIRCGTSMIYELEAIAESNRCFMISKFEAEIFKGLGVEVDHYPYLPIGEIKRRMINIRQKRIDHKINPSLFFLIGSVNHKTTYESFKWFINNCQRKGLPTDIEIIVGGRNSDQLGSEFPPMQNVKFLGQLEQKELEDYLLQACAVLIPQMSGFGAVTRVTEMACAGIPIIASKHVMNAISQPPGVIIANDNWSDWAQEINTLRNKQVFQAIGDYETWETKQPNTFIDTVRKYIA